MKRKLLIFASACSASLLAPPAAAPKTHLKIGDTRPALEFQLNSTAGGKVELSAFQKGKITFIEEGSAAVDVNSAMNACSRLKK